MGVPLKDGCAPSEFTAANIDSTAAHHKKPIRMPPVRTSAGGQPCELQAVVDWLFMSVSSPLDSIGLAFLIFV